MRWFGVLLFHFCVAVGDLCEESYWNKKEERRKEK
jgi:hypothetical protein